MVIKDQKSLGYSDNAWGGPYGVGLFLMGDASVRTINTGVAGGSPNVAVISALAPSQPVVALD